jgi:hypothetical protein
VIICPGNRNITACTYQAFISEKMIATGIAKPRKKKTDEIVPQIIEITHAASRIIS